MSDNSYRQTPPEGEEWAQYWKLLEEWGEVRGTAQDALALVHALATFRRALPYIFIIAAMILGGINKSMLLGLIK